MNKFKILAVLVLAVLLVSPVYALVSKTSQSQASDEVWTEVKIGDGYTAPVSRGACLVFSSDGAAVSDNDGFLVQHATATADSARVAGFVQYPIATGDTGLVLQRGRGYLRASGNYSSKDRLYAAAVSGLASGLVSSAGPASASDAKVIAVALEDSTASDDKIKKAYITVL